MYILKGEVMVLRDKYKELEEKVAWHQKMKVVLEDTRG